MTWNEAVTPVINIKKNKHYNLFDTIATWRSIQKVEVNVNRHNFGMVTKDFFIQMLLHSVQLFWRRFQISTNQKPLNKESHRTQFCKRTIQGVSKPMSPLSINSMSKTWNQQLPKIQYNYLIHTNIFHNWRVFLDQLQLCRRITYFHSNITDE